MKKQKKPIVLILAVGVLLGAAAFMNRGESKAESAPQPDAKQTQDKAADVASEVGSKLDEKPDPKAKKPDASGKETNMMKPRNGMTPNGPSRPSMIKANDVDHKPKPNLSNTAGQWYTDEANKK